MSTLVLIDELFPGGRGRVARAFELMEIAEEEIRAAMLRYPRSRKAVYNCFGVLCPSQPLSGKAPELFRHHCRELLERAVRGEDLRLATRAEVLCAISAMTLASRLDRDVELLGLTIAAEAFPEKGRDLIGLGREEDYRGSMEEKLGEFRRKLSADDRVLPEPGKRKDPPRGWERRR